MRDPLPEFMEHETEIRIADDCKTDTYMVEIQGRKKDKAVS
jgi:hypothetical protein